MDKISLRLDIDGLTQQIVDDLVREVRIPRHVPDFATWVQGRVKRTLLNWFGEDDVTK